MSSNPEARQDKRVLIVEDHDMVAGALRIAISGEPGFGEVMVAKSCASAIEATAEHDFDVIVTDFRLPDGDAPELITSLLSTKPSQRVLVVSGWSDDRSVLRAVEAGAHGYLTKTQPIEDLLAAVHEVARGDTAFAPELLGKLIRRVGASTRPGNDLTTREIEVLAGLAEGRTTQAIADSLGLSANTVRNHITSILSKLGAHSRLEAVTVGLRMGLVSPPD